MARTFCPECNNTIFPGASKCHTCSWTKQTTAAQSTSARCEKCGGRARQIELRGSKYTLCYQHYTELRGKDFDKVSPEFEAWYRKNVLVADFDRNLELVKKQNPGLSDNEAKNRAEAWTQMALFSFTTARDTAIKLADKFYEKM
jgi:hypothetical protein